MQGQTIPKKVDAIAGIEKSIQRLDAKVDTILMLAGSEITLNQFAKIVKRTPGTIRRWIAEEAWRYGRIPMFEKGGPNGGRWTCPVDRYLAWALREKALRHSAK